MPWSLDRRLMIPVMARSLSELSDLGARVQFVGHLRLRKSQLIKPGSQLCEHERGVCPFCRRGFHVGHYMNEPTHELVMRHDHPPCTAFIYAENVEDFALLSRLKFDTDYERRTFN